MKHGYLGIDVSKGYSDMVLLDEQFNRLSKPVQFDDTRQGHERFLTWIKRCMKDFEIDRIYAGVESTGGFEDNWYSLLIEAGSELPIHVARLNPLTVKRAAEATLSMQSTDALSASYIAEYIIRYHNRIEWDTAENHYRSYRSFDNHIRLLVAQQSAQLSQFKQLLYSCYPELLRFCREKIPNWVLELIKAYPSPKKLAKARVEELTRIAYVTDKKATLLMQAASESVASRKHHIDEYLLASMAAQIQNSRQHIRSLKNKLTADCKGQEVDLLTTINGIADYSAASLMVQIEDIRRFATTSKLSGYFGLHPKLKTSGDGKKVSVMSKNGRASVRSTLYLCANSAILKDEYLRNIYSNHREKGKSHKQAIGVVMHKMLRIIWGVLTTGKAYDQKVDQANRENHSTCETSEEQAHNELTSKRREQDLDPQAPISRIAHKKRKAFLQSQANDVELMRDHEKRPDVKHIKKFEITLEK